MGITLSLPPLSPSLPSLYLLPYFPSSDALPLISVRVTALTTAMSTAGVHRGFLRKYGGSPSIVLKLFIMHLMFLLTLHICYFVSVNLLCFNESAELFSHIRV